MSVFDKGYLDAAAGLAREAQLAEADARRTLEQAESHASVARKLAEAVEKGWPAQVLAVYRSNKDWIRAAAERDPSLRDALEGLQRQAESALATQRNDFPKLIEDAAKQRNIALDASSRHPKYTFADGFFTLIVDDARAEAVLSDYESDFGRVPADVQAVLDLVQKEHRRVFGRRFDGMRVLEKVRRNYLAILERESGKDGDPLPIRRITQRLGKNEKGFRTDEFAADLARLTRDGPYEIDGRALELQQTKDNQQGMLLPGLAGRGFVGFLKFIERTGG